MAIRATGGFGLLYYTPGNPEFPELPDGVVVPHFIDLSRVAGFRAKVVPKRRIFGSAPANDEQRFAGWQTDTTWISPTVIDFGVITSPIRATVSLYNTRFSSVDVTALDFGTTGVSLISPALTQTLDPYGGVQFTIEAGLAGPDSFDEFVTFTTAAGPASFRVIGRRVLSLNLVPQRPIDEALRFKTDLLRSKDGSEKAYRLLRSPSSAVQIRVRQTDDLARIKLHNQFIAGESALVVGVQKWWEATPLLSPVATNALELQVADPAFESWYVGGPVSVVSADKATVASAQVSAISKQPDPLVDNTTLHFRFDRPDGSTGDTDLSKYGNEITYFNLVTNSTTQSKFGGGSLYFPPGTGHQGTEVPDRPELSLLAKDFTIEFWFYPTTLSGDLCLMSHYQNSNASWRMMLRSTSIQFYKGGTARTFAFTTEVQANRWQHLAMVRSAGTTTCYIDGVQIGSPIADASAYQDATTPIYFGVYGAGGKFGQYNGYLDDIRWSDIARYNGDFTPPTEPFSGYDEQYTALALSSELGTAFDAGAQVMPVGLGYISEFPTWNTFPVNAEDIAFTVVFNQEADFSELPADWPTLDGIPILDVCNELDGQAKASSLLRNEDVLDSGLSNRVAFTRYPFSDVTSDFKVTLTTREAIWTWRKFFHWLGGSFNELYIPTFTEDFPSVTTAASNVFDMPDTDYAVLFGTTPPKRRDALRFEYPDGTIQYRTITAVVDNGATEQFTLSSAVLAGNPKISYMNLSRLFGDSVTFSFLTPQDAVVKFKYRAIQR